MKYSPSDFKLIDHHIFQTPIEGLLYIKHGKHKDERGFYSELSKIPELEVISGKNFKIEQLNLSYSTTGVGRGIHYENWNKLLTIISGKAYCAWVDLRKSSSTFGHTVEMAIDADNGSWGSVFVSAGIGNSFYVERGPLYYLYCVDQLYKNRDTSFDGAISMFDQNLKISWPVAQNEMILSDRDKNAQSLAQYQGKS